MTVASPPPIVTTANVSIHCQMSPGRHSHLWLRAVLEEGEGQLDGRALPERGRRQAGDTALPATWRKLRYSEQGLGPRAGGL